MALDGVELTTTVFWKSGASSIHGTNTFPVTGSPASGKATGLRSPRSASVVVSAGVSGFTRKVR